MTVAHIPDFHFTADTARGKQSVVGTERDAGNPSGRTAESGHLTTSGSLPKAHRTIVGARGEPLAIAAGSDRIETG